MSLFRQIETLSVDQIYALRVKRGKDQLLRYSPTLPFVLLLISVAYWLAFVVTIVQTGIPLSELLSHFMIYPNGPGTKGRPLWIGIGLAIFFALLGIWMVTSLFCWAKRRGQSPLLVSDHRICFDGKDYDRDNVSHLERRKFGPCSALAIILKDGQSHQMPDIAMFGPPVRDEVQTANAETRSWIRFQLLLNLLAIVTAILLLFFLFN